MRLSVAMDEMLSPVVNEITCASNIMAIIPVSPATPATQPKRRYMITPRMVNIEGVKTPEKAPNFFASPAIKEVFC